MPPIAFGFGSPADLMVIAVVALVVFGPKKLPELGKQLGQAMREFNKLRDELTGAVHSVRDEVGSVYEPIAKPYSQNHAVSSPTVEAAVSHRVYDQAPEDLMAPVVPVVKPVGALPAEHQDERLLVPPVPVTPSAPDEAHEKGH